MRYKGDIWFLYELFDPLFKTVAVIQVLFLDVNHVVEVRIDVMLPIHVYVPAVTPVKISLIEWTQINLLLCVEFVFVQAANEALAIDILLSLLLHVSELRKRINNNT